MDLNDLIDEREKESPGIRERVEKRTEELRKAVNAELYREGLDNPWTPWLRPSFPWFGYEVWQLRWSNFLGSSYRSARNKWGMRKWFLTRQAAQRYADRLNKGE